MTTGESIRSRRKELGMSVDELAAKVGKNRATIYRYESDAIEMPASMLKPLADALDTTPDDLMAWTVLLDEIVEHEKRMSAVLPLIQNGISYGGNTNRYLIFKTPTQGGQQQFDLNELLSVLYRLNTAGCKTEIHNLRILTEIASSLDMGSLESLVSYAEFLDTKCKEKRGENDQHPYQLEQSAILEPDE